VWVIDDQLHVIYRFTYDGKLEHTLGQLGVRGRGPNTFDRPTDIAWLPDGTYFISDGYGGTRVAKFDRNDKFLMDWGSAPKNPAQPGPSEFNTPHSIAISADRRVFVVDRGHQRMQVFDENGKFLDMWPLRSPTWPAEISTLVTNHIITSDGFIWAGDAGTNRILKYDLNGNFSTAGERRGRNPVGSIVRMGYPQIRSATCTSRTASAAGSRNSRRKPTQIPQRLVGQILRFAGR
jgi:DNA-binding beta-propeller fold protein YncE